MKASQLAGLAAGLAAGSITANSITEEHGDGVLSAVLAIGTGGLVGAIAGKATEVFVEETGLGDFIDELFD